QRLRPTPIRSTRRTTRRSKSASIRGTETGPTWETSSLLDLRERITASAIANGQFVVSLEERISTSRAWRYCLRRLWTPIRTTRAFAIHPILVVGDSLG